MADDSSSVNLQFALIELKQKEEEPPIGADFVSLVCADQRTGGSVNQRFHISGEGGLNRC